MSHLIYIVLVARMHILTTLVRLGFSKLFGFGLIGKKNVSVYAVTNYWSNVELKRMSKPHCFNTIQKLECESETCPLFHLCMREHKHQDDGTGECVFCGEMIPNSPY